MELTAHDRDSDATCFISVDADDTIGSLKRKIIATLSTGHPTPPGQPSQPDPAHPANGISRHTLRAFELRLSDTGEALPGEDGTPLSNTPLEGGCCLELVRVGPILAAPVRYEGKAKAIALSGCGGFLAVGGWDADTVALHDTHSRETRWVSGGSQRGYVSCVRVSPASTQVASSATHVITIRSASDGKPLCTADTRCAAHTLCYTPSGTHIAIGCGDASIRLLCTTTGSLITTLRGHTASVRKVDAAGNLLLSCSGDTTVRVWQIPPGGEEGWVEGVSGSAVQPHHILRGHTAWVEDVAVAEDSSVAVSAGDDMVVRVWCLVSFTCLHGMAGHAASVYRVSISAASGLAVTRSGAEAKAMVWDLRTGKPSESFAVCPAEPDEPSWGGIALTPCGGWLVQAYRSHVGVMWLDDAGEK